MLVATCPLLLFNNDLFTANKHANVSIYILGGNSNSNWSIYIAPPTRRPRADHRADQSVSWCRYTYSNWYIFSWCRKNASVVHSSFRSVGSLFHARCAATEKAMLLIRQRVCGTTRSPDNAARNVDLRGISATGVSRSKIYSGVRADPAMTCELASTTWSSRRLITNATLGANKLWH